MAAETAKQQAPEQQEDNPEVDPPPLLLQDSGVVTSQPLRSASPPPHPESSSAPLPADAASKRQRRPNVRLNEIGCESSLANVVEYLLKQRKGQGHAGVVGGKRGRPPKLAAPGGKLPKKAKHSPKFSSDDKADGKEYGDGDDEAGVNVGDHGDDAEFPQHAEGSKPDSKKPFEKQQLLTKQQFLTKKKAKHLPKFRSDDKAGGECDDDDEEEDAGVDFRDVKSGHHAEPDSKKPFERQQLIKKGKNRKQGNLGKNKTIATATMKHAKPKVILPCVEGNGNNWMHKTADGFLEAADGAVYACSDTEKRTCSPSPHAQPAIFSFDSDTPKVLKKTQSAAKRRKKEAIDSKLPSAPECMPKDGAIEEKEEPSSSALQELRMQGPVWERGLPPLDEKVREWMQKIGLEKYSTIFQHHEVSDDVVPLLTMGDLKEMGIQAVGARRKFYSEITKRRQSMMLNPNESLLAEEK